MRTEIEPADIKTLLADTFILEKDARGEAVFRLAGTRLCAIYGRELKGFAFVSLWREQGPADDRAPGAQRVQRQVGGRRRFSWHRAATAAAMRSSWCCCRSTADWRTRAASAPSPHRKAVLAGRRSDRRGQRRFGPRRRSRPRAGVPEEPAGSRGSVACPVACGARPAGPATAAASATWSCSKAGAKNSYLRSNAIGSAYRLLTRFAVFLGLHPAQRYEID